jgi:hypothetical protein
MAILLQQYLARMREVRIQETRPSTFRQIFTTPAGAPMVEKLDDIVEQITDTEVVPYGEMRVIGSSRVNVKMTEFDSSQASAYARTAAIGYRIFDEELLRLDAGNIPIRALKGAANYNIAEAWLEKQNLLGSAQYGFGSLLTNSSVATVVLATKAATGVAWTNATHEEVVQDILAISQAVYTNTYQVLVGDTVILPDVSYNIACNKAHATSGKNAIAVAMERDPRIRRILPLAQLVGSGAGATNRAVALCSSPLVCQMSERAFREETEIRIPMGFEVTESVRTAGCIWGNTQGAVYADGL